MYGPRIVTCGTPVDTSLSEVFSFYKERSAVKINL